MLLEHERQVGSSASDDTARLQAQLADERRSKAALAQTLSSERSARSQAESGAESLRRELAAKARELEVSAQRVQQLQAEVHFARSQGHADASARQPPRAAPPAGAAPARPPALGGGQALPSGHPATQHAMQGQPAAGGARAGGLSASDELDRSDLWNFQYGVAGRAGARGGGGGGRDLLGAPLPGACSLPKISNPYNTAAAPAADIWAGHDDDDICNT